MKRKLTCLCEHSFEADLPEVVDLAADPAREDDILAGTFMNVACPKCGKLLKLELPVRVRDRARDLDLFLLPSLERNRYLAGKFPEVPAGVARVVIGYPELVEKLRIARAGLDDRVVEIVKFHLMRRAEQDNPGKEISIYFASRGAGELTFEVHGLRAGEVGRVRVSEERAAKVAEELPRNLKREPYRSFLGGPYVSCTAVYETDGSPEDPAEGSES